MATSTGLRVCDATSSGPAASAMPSPRFDVHDDAEQPPEPAAEPGRCDDVEEAAHEGENLPAGCRPRHRRFPGGRPGLRRIRPAGRPPP